MKVVGTLFIKENKLLLVKPRRRPTYQLPAGKVEEGETKEQALIRECREELNITLSVGDVFTEVVHEYPDITVHLTLFNAEISEGVPELLEHNDLKWITPSEIPNYNFCPADKDILKKITKGKCYE